ncbi:uncharacterized protein LOC144906544 [Branchiostoma floridae x Branchiostoma belcheri]
MAEVGRPHNPTTVTTGARVNPTTQTPPVEKRKDCTVTSFAEVLSQDPVVFPDEENEDSGGESSSFMERFVVDVKTIGQENHPIWEMKTAFLKKYVPYKNKRRWYIGSNCYVGWAGDKAMDLKPVTCKFVRRENYKTVVKVVNPANVANRVSSSVSGQYEGRMLNSTTPKATYCAHDPRSQDKVKEQLGTQYCASDASQLSGTSSQQGQEWAIRSSDHILEGTTTEWDSTSILPDHDLFEELKDLPTLPENFSTYQTDEQENDQERTRDIVETLLAGLETFDGTVENGAIV